MSATTWTGAVIATTGAITFEQWMAIIGVTLAVLGFIVNLVFKWRQDRRDVVRLRAEMADH